MTTRRGLIFITLTLLSLLVSTPADAGWRTDSKSNGVISVATVQQKGGSYLVVNVLPVTGVQNAGKALLRFDGVIVDVRSAPPYTYLIPLKDDQVLRAINDPKTTNGQKEAGDIIMDSAFFATEHGVEVLFYGQDGRGRDNIKHGESPAIQFRLFPLDSKGGAAKQADMTTEQVDALAKQAFDQGRTETEKAFDQERQQLRQTIEDLQRQLGDKKANNFPETELRIVTMILTKPFRDGRSPIGERYVAVRKDDNKSQKTWMGEGEIISFDPATNRVRLAAVIVKGAETSALRFIWQGEKK